MRSASLPDCALMDIHVSTIRRRSICATASPVNSLYASSCTERPSQLVSRMKSASCLQKNIQEASAWVARHTLLQPDMHLAAATKLLFTVGRHSARTR